MTPQRKRIIQDAAVNRQFDLAVVLENVHDRHNISAVLRSCDAVGIADVHILYTDPDLQKKRKIFMGKRTSAGTRKWMNVIRHHDRKSCFAELKEKYTTVFGTHLGEESKSLYQVELSQPAAIVFGNEHSGLTPETAALCDGHLFIPQFGFGMSLNISVACAIVVFEACRQRGMKGMYERTLDDPLTIQSYNQLKERFDSKDNGRIITHRYDSE